MKPLVLLFVVLLAWSRPAGAQAVALNRGRLLSDSVFVERPYQSVGGLVVLRVTVAGKRCRFLLDTGAPTLLSSRLQARFRFPVLGKTAVYDAYRHRDSAAVVALSEIGIDALRLADVPALVVDAGNPLFAALGIDGILGSNALRELCVTISSRRRTVVLTDRPAAADAATVPMQTDGDLQSTPEIAVSLDGKPAGTFLFDSGFQGLCDLSQATRQQLQTEAALAIRVVQGGASFSGLYGDAPQGGAAVAVGVLGVGGVRVSNLVATASNDTRSKIGAELFQYGDVLLDYRGGRFAVRPYRDR